MNFYLLGIGNQYHRFRFRDYLDLKNYEIRKITNFQSSEILNQIILLFKKQKKYGKLRILNYKELEINTTDSNFVIT